MLVQLVKIVYGACHSSYQWRNMSSRHLWLASSVLSIPLPAGARKDGHNLDICKGKYPSVLFALYCFGKCRQWNRWHIYLLGFLVIQSELSRDWLGTSGRAQESLEWLLSMSATELYLHTMGLDYLWFDLWVQPSSSTVLSHIKARGVVCHTGLV